MPDSNTHRQLRVASLPLPKMAVSYNASNAGPYALIFVVLMGVAALCFFMPSSSWIFTAVKRGVGFVSLCMALLFLYLLSIAVFKTIGGLWRSRNNLRPPLPPALVRAQDLLNLIPLPLRTEFPDQAICAVYGKLLAQENEEFQSNLINCLLVGERGLWHELILEQDGHILNALGQRFIDPLAAAPVAWDEVHRQNFQVEGVKMGGEECLRSFAPAKDITSWLDANDLDQSCSLASANSPARRL